MSKVKYLHSKHIPPRMNILWLPVVYMMVGYFGLPIWVFFSICNIVGDCFYSSGDFELQL